MSALTGPEPLDGPTGPEHTEPVPTELDDGWGFSLADPIESAKTTSADLTAATESGPTPISDANASGRDAMELAEVYEPRRDPSERRAARPAYHPMPEPTVVRPVGLRLGIFEALRSIPPRKRTRIVALLGVAGLILFFTVRQGYGSGNVAWSARANLVATADEVIKLPTLGLPLQDASADDLTRQHAARAEARAAGARQAKELFVESVRYVGPRVESAEGTVSVFAGRTLWAAASREPNGSCVWALISPSAWGRLYQAGNTATCQAADAVLGAHKVLDAEKAHPLG